MVVARQQAAVVARVDDVGIARIGYQPLSPRPLTGCGPPMAIGYAEVVVRLAMPTVLLILLSA
ncbi:MAG: hypothetical protein U5J83_00735 [Bryobacterales bacterium]|nr:hypothetical protein [Bryobacterales bacterium]